MGPLHDIAIAIRCRFIQDFRRRGESRGSSERSPAIDEIHRGNRAAHNGDVIADAGLIEMGHITDLAAFKELYGMEHNRAKKFFSMNPTIT